MWAWAASFAAQAMPADTPAVRVSVDSARWEVVVTAGPFTLPPMPADEHGSHDLRGHYTPLYRFTWPVSGWVRGFDASLTRPDGAPLDRRLLHHITLLNFSRRQLLGPYVERLFAFGSETRRVLVPRTVGIPVPDGSALGMYMAWANHSDTAIAGVYLRLRLHWMPRTMLPEPTSALPLAIETKGGQSGAFDLPPGPSEKSWEFEMPLDGRIIGAGGHLHDYARRVELHDLTAGRLVLRLAAHLDSLGRIHGVARTLPGIYGRGIKLHAGHRYRVTAVYQNPTGKTLKRGAMGAIGAAFVPDDFSRWPAVDSTDPAWQKDVAWMERLRLRSARAPEAPGAAHRH